MADRRRGKQKRQQELTEKPTKEEKAVAKYLRFNVPVKEGKLVGLPVQYFIANDAINGLLESKWASTKGKSSETLFTNRGSCADYCHRLLMKGMFHRATRVERKRDKDRDKKKKKVKEDGEDGTCSKKEEEGKTKKEKKSKKEKEDTAVKKEESDGDKEDKDKEEKKDEKKRKKERKIKLEMADKQVFKDGEEIYVWIYDPVPLKTFIIGLFLVLGAIAVCLFPLWPPEVRLGIYYLSLSVAGLIGILLSLCVVRVILFGLVWVFTFGRHHFWLLPNLNEDVGFFDSFKPLYFHESFSKSDTKDIEDEDKTEAKEIENTAKEDDKSPQSIEAENITEVEGEKEAEESGTGSELDNDNGYEIVDPEELINQGSTEEDPEGDEEPTEDKKTK